MLGYVQPVYNTVKDKIVNVIYKKPEPVVPQSGLYGMYNNAYNAASNAANYLYDGARNAAGYLYNGAHNIYDKANEVIYGTPVGVKTTAKQQTPTKTSAPVFSFNKMMGRS